MLSENIKRIRKEKQLTQKELADLLRVTYLDVVKWERGEIEPSTEIIVDMAEILEVSVDDLLDEHNGEQNAEKNDDEKITKIAKQVAVETAKQMEGSNRHYVCGSVDKRQEKEEKIAYGVSQRHKSFGWSGFYAGLVLLAGIIFTTTFKQFAGVGIVATIILALATFTFSSCLFLKNNFLEEVFLEVASWGFVTFPGLITTFDLDGLFWLIGMKILFWIVGFSLGLLASILALAISLPLSLIVYPFALIKNIQNPELTER